MRKEIVLALGLGLMLVGVLFTQSKLRESVKESTGETIPGTGDTPPAATPASESAAEPDSVPTRELDPKVGEPHSSNEGSTSVPEQNVEPGTSQSPGTSIQRSFQLARKVFHQKEAIAQSSAEEVHRTPKETVAAADQLGNIVELEEKHPEEAKSFQDFYLECARDDKVITVIRSQCLDRYAKLAKLDKAQQSQFLREFPPEIVRLFDALQ